MSTQPNPTDHADAAERAESNLLPSEERRGVAEWAVVLVLVALIAGVAWSQFGGLFDTSTAGSAGSAPAGAPGLELVAPEPSTQAAEAPRDDNGANQERP